MHHKLLIGLFALPRPYERGLQVLTDAFLLTCSFALAMVLRTERLDFMREPTIWLGFTVAMICTLLLFTQIGFYRAVVRYIGLRAYFTIFNGVAASAGALSLLAYLADLPIPGTVPLIYAVLALVTVGGGALWLAGDLPPLPFALQDPGHRLWCRAVRSPDRAFALQRSGILAGRLR